MCGICGAVSARPDRRTDRAILDRMCDRVRHRGPDDQGCWLDAHAALGMRRLSIIDLKTGKQPLTDERQQLRLVFNGEIYNYRELREKYTKKGHVFATQSDTEVIIHAYEEYGERCVNELNGMFAFALWDPAKQRLLLARDHLGIKPLYYWAGDGLIVFGSELKSILAHPAVPRQIDLAALDQFLTLEYIPAPRTIFADIHKLPAGHWLTFAGGGLRIEQYWDISFQPVSSDEETSRERLAELLRDAVRLQMVSDVPIGAFLSGGIDSSSVVSFMAEASPDPVKTFSIGFGDATYNELPFARAVAARYKTEHYEEVLEPNITGLVEKLVGQFDEPFGDFSIFPTYLVSKVARQRVKVVLSGDGGDELFGGYDTYIAQNMDRFYRKLPSSLRRKAFPALLAHLPPQPAKKGLINKAKRFVEGAALPDALRHARWMVFMNPDDRAALYSADFSAALNGSTPAGPLLSWFDRFPEAGPLAQQQYVDIKTYLVDDILTKVDRMSMAVSLETRVPLLDYRIVEFAVNLPPHLKIARGETKRILRQVMQDRLPDVVLNKPKQGFSIPIKHWLRGPLQPMMQDLLAPGGLRRRGYFEPEVVAAWIREHCDGRVNHSHRLWALMVFEIWHRQAFDASPVAAPVRDVGKGKAGCSAA